MQLAGPSIVEQLRQLRTILEGFGAGSVLIDGALSRKSPAACAADGACVLSTGASLHRNMDYVVAETAFAAKLLSLPELPLPGAERGRVTLFRPDGTSEGAAAAAELRRGGGENTLFFSGALTETQAKALLRDGTDKRDLTVLVKDGSCLLLRRETFDALTLRGVRFAAVRGTRLAAVTANPVAAGGWAFDGGAFLRELRAAVEVPVLDVMEDAEWSS